MIEQFRGETRFLSNMFKFETPIRTSAGIWVHTSEHAYQAEKFVHARHHLHVAQIQRGIDSKNLAHDLEVSGAAMLEDWDTTKLEVMNRVVHDKFMRNPYLAQMLVNTGDQEIVEGNTWGDKYWGVCPPGSDNGENNLGRILMNVRAELLTI